MRKLIWTLPFVALSATAWAQSVGSMITFGLASGISSRNVTVWSGDGAAAASTGAGPFQADFSALGGLSNAATFCLEFHEFISFETQTFLLLDVEQGARGTAPGNIGAPPTGNEGAGLPAGGGAFGGIGSRATLLQYLYGRYYGSASASDAYWTQDRGAAFQLAVWELTHDTNFDVRATGTGTNPTRTGTFQLWTSGTETVEQVNALAHVILAQQWITQVQNDFNASTDLASLPFTQFTNLATLVHDAYVPSGLAPALVDRGTHIEGRQDLIVPLTFGNAVPEPAAAAALAGLFTLAACALRRPRRA